MSNKKNRIFLELIKKNYIYINLTGLFLSIYIILFPLISTALNKVFPGIFDCIYLKITGKPCPLCGGTRYLKNIGETFNDITYLFHPFGIMIIFVIFEFWYRLYNIIFRRKEKSIRYIRIDVIIHIVVAICFFMYEITFIIIQNI